MGDARRRALRSGSDGLLVEVGDLAEALALFASLSSDPPVGVRELVPAARTVLIRFDPGETSARVLANEVLGRPVDGAATVSGATVEIGVRYDGADLAEVAALLGLGPEEVVRRHTASAWTVAFTGFAPGFAYLTGGDPVLDVPRRAEPRTSIPAGSVALGGGFSGIYPRASPGGWQLIGRTDAVLWDERRPDPALLAPGVRVRFVDVGARVGAAERPPVAVSADGRAMSARSLEIVDPGVLTVVVDLGRPGRAAQGVARSGAVDRGSFRRANRLVGNPTGAPVLELAGGGQRFRAAADLVVAVTGSEVAVERVPDSGLGDVRLGRAFALDAGSELQVGAPSRGTFAYLAVAGGVEVDLVLGSASSDLMAGIGPAPLRSGSVVRVGTARESAVMVPPEPIPPLPAPGETTEIEVLLGPRDDWFDAEAVRLFLGQEWVVTPRSNRVGVRLSGERPLERSRTDELRSEGMVPGSIQVPPTGQPVVLTADHPVTGGYPVIACVVTEDQDPMAQVPVGGRIRFSLRRAAT